MTVSEIVEAGPALAGAPIHADDASIARILGKGPVLWVGAGLSIAAGYPTTGALIDALVAAADDPIDRTRSFYEVLVDASHERREHSGRSGGARPWAPSLTTSRATSSLPRSTGNWPPRTTSSQGRARIWSPRCCAVASSVACTRTCKSGGTPAWLAPIAWRSRSSAAGDRNSADRRCPICTARPWLVLAHPRP